MSISSASELVLSLISFAGSDSTLTWQGGGKRKRRRQEGWGWGASIQGRQLIEGRLLFEEMWYTPLRNFGLKIYTMCRLKHMFVF